MFCGKCGQKVDDGKAFCPFCGNKLSNEEAATGRDNIKAPVIGETVMLDDSRPKATTDNQQFKPGQLPAKDIRPVTIHVEKKSNTLVKILIIVAVILIISVSLLLFVVKTINNNKPEKIAYLKDNTLYLTDTNCSESQKLGKIQEDGYKWRYEHNIFLSEDERYILFGLEKNDTDLVDLYYAKDGDEAELICEDIDEYYLSSKMAIYRVDDKLYSFDFKNKEEEKITDNIIKCFANKNSEVIAYIDDDNILCTATYDNDDVIEIDEGATQIYGASSDMKHLVYAKDDSLYVCTEDQESEFIADNFDDDSVLVSEGEKLNICFSTPEIAVAYLFVDDDLSEDEATDVRQKLQYTQVFESGSYSSLNIYKKELDKNSKGTLSSVTGGLVLSRIRGYDILGDNMVCLMSFVEDDDIPRIKLSDFEEDYGTEFEAADIENIVKDSVKDQWEWKINRKGVMNECDDIKGTPTAITTDAKDSEYCYISLYDDEKDAYEIGKINLRGKTTGKYDTVYKDAAYLWYTDNGNIVYNDVSGNLCVNDTKIDKNIDSVEIIK